MHKYIINEYEFDIAIKYLKRHTRDYIKEELDYLSDEYLPLNKKIEKLEDIINSEQLKSDLIKIKRSIEDERITKSELLWIDNKNHRLCNYIYYILNNRRKLYLLNNTELDLPYLIDDESYEIDHDIYKNTIKTNSINHQEKYNSICEHIIKSNFNKETKLNLIHVLKESWRSVSECKIITNFLNDKDINKCAWAVEYLKKNKKDRFDFEIISEEDYYDNVVLYFDTCDDKYKKELLITKMKKAWSQKKCRDAKNGFKYYSFNMKESINNKLSEMSRELNISKNLLVEKIIEKEYKQFKDNLK
ncbi:TPA: hypothetical protein ACX6Q5_002642 [Photobacterium damselae]